MIIVLAGRHLVCRFRVWGIALLSMLPLLLCQGCSYLQLWQQTYSDQALPAQDFHFQDGGHAIYFSFEKRLAQRFSEKTVRPIDTYLFVIAGSDCTSMGYFLPYYFRGLEGESGPIRIFILHKRFIEARTWGRIAGCSEDFIKSDHPSRWIADQTEFIHAQLALASQNNALPKRIAVLGISEGGEIVPVLARHIPAITHAAILSNGGMDPLDAYRLQAKKHGFAAAIDALAVLNQPAPADPDAIANRIGGRTWRYWFELQQLTQTEALLRLTIPILIAMGEADQAVPIESAWHIRDHFVMRGKSNLTLITYPEADHGLHSPNGSRLPDFFHSLDLWLEK
jgi:pimeloyl-ACP methyl ester carboxylesterase